MPTAACGSGDTGFRAPGADRQRVTGPELNAQLRAQHLKKDARRRKWFLLRQLHRVPSVVHALADMASCMHASILMI
jgi:hypothetical protein